MPGNNILDKHLPGCVDIVNKITNMEAIDYSTTDQAPTFVTTDILITTAGTLKVDMLGLGTGISLPLTAGWHQLRITKIYKTGSSTAVGWLAS